MLNGQKNMELYSNHQEIKQKDLVEQIRGSIIVVVVKLIIILIIFEAIYELFFYFLSIQFALPIDWHHHISVGLLIMSMMKVLLEVYFITSVFLAWAGNVWLLTGKHIIRRTGIFHTQEDVYHFDNLRTISVEQSLLGKIFNYGDITIKISASGGYQGDVSLSQIENPHMYETMIKNLF